MPRIAVALGVVATIAICIAINTYRYPMVREMVATAPQLRLPTGHAQTDPTSSEPKAAAASSRSAPAVALASAGRASSDPKPSWRSDATEPAAPVTPPKKKVKGKAKPPKAPLAQAVPDGGKKRASGKSSHGMEEDLPDAGPTGPAPTEQAAADHEQPGRPPTEPEQNTSLDDQQTARADSLSEDQKFGEVNGRPSDSPSVIEPESKYGSLAPSKPTSGSEAVTGRPMAPLADLGGEDEVKAAAVPLPDWKTPAAEEKVERLPPVDQVWGEVPEIAPADGDRIAIYPDTGL